MSEASKNPEVSISQRLARGILAAQPHKAAGARDVGRRMVLDIASICIAARAQPYVAAAMASVDADGPCTVLGHTRKLGVEGAAFVNGIAAHGEDFDDTFEGGPVHAGVVIVPALIAAAERHGFSGQDFLRGLAVGSEVMCRLCAVAPTRVHKAGFHPTAVFGVMGAVAGVGAALRLTEQQLVDAFGIAGSMASGIIEYLADGSWTKRMHPGWAAQSGYRAVRLALEGFKGPRTVFEGTHGLFHGFANTLDGNFDAMMAGFGETWIWPTIAFKPYACGTMCHPYIDCAREFGKLGLDPASIASIECEAAEGVLHRLWEPLDQKRRPPNGYAAKFSVPYAIAVAIVRGDAGLREYDDVIVKDPAILGVASKVTYVVDPANPYPRQFTGHVRVKMADGSVHEFRQGYFKGGAEHPLSDEDLARKFEANCAYGGLSEADARALLAHIDSVFDQATVGFSLSSR
ncbi:2-methylcitrate dehydratase [Bordetella sp. H567]|uniref:MmgE/PrpD family protein n=1 Tax=Bordetella sp. H567 TaxID=1697043 RepID=UPI00081C9AD6|nr:MmgE/PrpD family protein [Bordetella sp. H567]AOB32684.1 2-methylcitrate dehydratase [Bordetella sp. H567]